MAFLLWAMVGDHPLAHPPTLVLLQRFLLLQGLQPLLPGLKLHFDCDDSRITEANRLGLANVIVQEIFGSLLLYHVCSVLQDP